MYKPRFECATNKKEFRFCMPSHSFRSSKTLSLGSCKPNCDIRVRAVRVRISISIPIKIIIFIYYTAQSSVIVNN